MMMMILTQVGGAHAVGGGGGAIELPKHPAHDVDGLLIDVSVGRQVWGVNAANGMFRPL
jgi:hypothetical protein